MGFEKISLEPLVAALTKVCRRGKGRSRKPSHLVIQMKYTWNKSSTRQCLPFLIFFFPILFNFWKIPSIQLWDSILHSPERHPGHGAPVGRIYLCTLWLWLWLSLWVVSSLDMGNGLKTCWVVGLALLRRTYPAGLMRFRDTKGQTETSPQLEAEPRRTQLRSVKSQNSHLSREWRLIAVRHRDSILIVYRYREHSWLRQSPADFMTSCDLELKRHLSVPPIFSVERPSQGPEEVSGDGTHRWKRSSEDSRNEQIPLRPASGKKWRSG